MDIHLFAVRMVAFQHLPLLLESDLVTKKAVVYDSHHFCIIQSVPVPCKEASAMFLLLSSLLIVINLCLE